MRHSTPFCYSLASSHLNTGQNCEPASFEPRAGQLCVCIPAVCRHLCALGSCASVSQLCVHICVRWTAMCLYPSCVCTYVCTAQLCVCIPAVCAHLCALDSCVSVFQLCVHICVRWTAVYLYPSCVCTSACTGQLCVCIPAVCALMRAHRCLPMYMYPHIEVRRKRPKLILTFQLLKTGSLLFVSLISYSRLAGSQACSQFSCPLHCALAGITDAFRCIWLFVWVLGIEPKLCGQCFY